jgi:predicted protein tyrosine phosphatase
MFVEALNRHLLVCAHVELPEILGSSPAHWNVVSIREPDHPQPDLANAKRACEVIFLDQESNLAKFGLQPPSPAHLESIFQFADAQPADPLLVHCWAGRSRSTAVALALIVRGFWKRDVTDDALITQSVDTLLAIRPFASPNKLVLRYGLDLFLPTPLAETVTRAFVNEPRLAQNRTGFIPW